MVFQTYGPDEDTPVAETVQQPVLSLDDNDVLQSQLAQASDSDDEDDLLLSYLQKTRDATRRWKKTESETVIPDDVRLQNVGVYLPMFVKERGKCEYMFNDHTASVAHVKYSSVSMKTITLTAMFQKIQCSENAMM